MFSIPQPKPSLSHDIRALPIVPCTEDSTTLRLLLWHCYPFPESAPVINDFATVNKVLEAAQKYYMGRVIGSLESIYLRLSSDSIKTQPVAAYALSCHHNWTNLKQASLKAALLFSHSDIQAQLASSGHQPSTQDSLKLLQYHFKCHATTLEFLNSRFTYDHEEVEHAKRMLETKGPMAIIQHLEEVVARYIAQGFGGVTGVNMPAQLPVEIWAMVVANHDSQDRSSLLPLQIVSKRLHALVTPLLYETISITFSDVDTFIHFAMALGAQQDNIPANLGRRDILTPYLNPVSPDFNAASIVHEQPILGCIYDLTNPQSLP
ncbi:hypothetical protein ONZ45_g10081 [Pleurotus djamor]|nr:hypothetical protein ONZ45_g10081 [Pleurotus djamor]